jgi:hypothetical protein
MITFNAYLGMQTYWVIEQIIVMLLKFDDIRNRSINIEFEAKDTHPEWAAILG